MKNIIVFTLAVILGAAAFFIFYRSITPQSTQPLKTPQTSSSPLPHLSVETPPSDSLKGAITSLSGKVDFQSRTATSSSSLASPTPLEQGEEVITGDNGNLKVTFDEKLLISLSPKTDIYFVQTLPTNLVIQQMSGSANYSNPGETPLSVRSLHLLINQQNAQIGVTTDSDKGRVTVLVTRGEVTVAFNDTQNISNVVTIKSGQTAVFDDSTRTLNYL